MLLRNPCSHQKPHESPRAIKEMNCQWAQNHRTICDLEQTTNHGQLGTNTKLLPPSAMSLQGWEPTTTLGKPISSGVQGADPKH